MNGHAVIVGDYVPGGNYFGTWTSGALDRPDADGPISSFTASFKFAFNNNSNGSGSSDGFSFLFGSMNDLDGSSDSGHSYLPNWNGGEWGFNNFSRLNGGISVGFDTYGGDAGAYARWGKDTRAQNNMNENWLDHVTYYGYDYALYDQHQATMEVEWTRDGDLVVYLTTPDKLRS